VLCHGYGANGEQQLTRAHILSAAFPDAVVVCPHAHRPVKDDPAKRRWFATRSPTAPPPPTEVREAVSKFDAFVDAERARYNGPVDGYALIGFSQGGSIVLASGLNRPDPPRALIAFAALLPLWRSEWDSISAKTPTLISSGEDDPVVPIVMARRTVQILRHAGVPVESRWLPGVAHKIDRRGLVFAIRFLREHFGHP
jgi:phospholipase/carboxylesterase